MGRTVLPDSMALAEQQRRLGQFRRSLRKQDQELLDELFERASLHEQVAVQTDRPESMDLILISMLIEMLRVEKQLSARVKILERELGDAKK